MGRKDIDKLREKVGTFDEPVDAPIGAVQLPATGVKLDRRGNPKPLQSGQDEHPEPAPRGTGTRTRTRKQPDPELAFTTELFVADPVERSVLAACHKALSGTQLTVDQLRRKLVAKEFDEAAIEHAIERCIAAGLLDDDRFTEAFVESRVRRGHGAQRIRQDLFQRGVDRASVDAALALHQESGALDEAAVVAAQRKFARIDLDDAKARNKAFRWLLSRGYSSAQADAALRSLRQERADAES